MYKESCVFLKRFFGEIFKRIEILHIPNKKKDLIQTKLEKILIQEQFQLFGIDEFYFKENYLIKIKNGNLTSIDDYLDWNRINK